MVTHKEKNRVAQKRFRQRQKVCAPAHLPRADPGDAGQTPNLVGKHGGKG